LFYGFCPFTGYGSLVLFGVFLLLAGTVFLSLRSKERGEESRRISSAEVPDRRLVSGEISEHENTEE